MLSDMMKPNMQRVDYLNYKAVGIPGSFGIYIRGCLKEDQPYCCEAKRNLYICLDYVCRYLVEEKMVAVYIDIYDMENAENLVFQQMSADLRKGLIEKVLFADLEEIFRDSSLNNKVFDLIDCVMDIKFFDVDGNFFEGSKVPLKQLLDV